MRKRSLRRRLVERRTATGGRSIKLDPYLIEIEIPHGARHFGEIKSAREDAYEAFAIQNATFNTNIVEA